MGQAAHAPGYTVGDTCARCSGDVGLINLEEGLLDTWAWKRIVLVGDAVRKLEPHAGLGYNSGVTDLVVLINGLRRLSSNGQARAPPTTEDLEALFSAYQAQRMEDTPAIVAMSERRARMCAWLGVKDWFMATLVSQFSRWASTASTKSSGQSSAVRPCWTGLMRSTCLLVACRMSIIRGRRLGRSWCIARQRRCRRRSRGYTF